MRITVLGGCGAFPTAEQPCSGFLVEHASFRLVMDLGYATMPQLLRHAEAEQIDAVVISHGHPDHCVDVNPLLRARALGGHPPPALRLYALPGALDAVLALDRPSMLAEAYVLHEFTAGTRLRIGPFDVETRLLPHFVPNAGMRLTAGGRTLAYTGDTGPSPDVVGLARNADLLVAEASFAAHVPDVSVGHLSSAREAAEQATEAGAARLVLTHLFPTTDAMAARAAARGAFHGPIDIATPGLAIDLA